MGSLLLTNSDFRVFLGDLTTIGREVFRDTALTLSTVSEQVGKQVAPSREEVAAAKRKGGESQLPPSSEDFQEDAAEISNAVARGASEVAAEAGTSLSEHVSKDERETLLARLRQAALSLRQKRDYADSVSALSLFLRRYLKMYFLALSQAAEGAEEDIKRNGETDRALRNLWGFLTSLGDEKLWRDVEVAFKAVIEASQSDPEFEKHVDQIVDLFQSMFMDPEFYDDAEQRFAKLRGELQQLTTESRIRDNIDTLLTSLRLACCSICEDGNIRNVYNDSRRIIDILFPTNQNINKELISDCINTLLPHLINAVQYIPVPRLEISTPELDLLLENLVLEPGETVNHSSFLPYRMNFSTLNNVEILKGRVRTTSSMGTVFRVKLSGISVSASDIGYWIRCHSGLLRFGSEGIASMRLDQRGIDVVLDLEIGRDRIDELISVRHVGVRIHHFNYTLSKSKVSWLAWLVKPLLRPIIRITIETQIADAIKDACESVNRELLFARERLRATRIANPNDMWTFIRAVSTRMAAPRQDADRFTRIGVDEPGAGVFEGVYAPGSLAKVWNEETTLADERVGDFRQSGWRNSIFRI
ncbi:uncharacterized protein DNG_01702 [Cephalotrichum gorgonifer]|uniref:HAM1-like N-terminal domain-containing protein n=1 Tax=Cephalotrichum gorgonifer TaxID=2041049 RepID=A0AAE8MTQ6_9PEZI|nr:uncharacterized protein DNG_01702 [Cephalotrichum gorgonifer]